MCAILMTRVPKLQLQLLATAVQLSVILVLMPIEWLATASGSHIRYNIKSEDSVCGFYFTLGIRFEDSACRLKIQDSICSFSEKIFFLIYDSVSVQGFSK